MSRSGAAPPRSTTRGVVLVFVVLLNLALSAVAHGLLVAARARYVTAQVVARSAALQAEADGAVVSSMIGGADPRLDSVGIGEVWVVTDSLDGGVLVRTSWRRLAREGWLIEADARATAGGRARSSRLVSRLDPEARIDALHGVVSIDTGATVVLDGALDAEGTAPLALVSDVALGQWSLERLLDSSTPVGAEGTPWPVARLGSCSTTEAWNWGDPERPSSPCGDHVAMVSSRSSLLVRGGVGQVLLTVDGDVVLDEGTQVHGMILSTGRLILRNGSRFAGRAVALGGLDVDAESRVVGSRDWALRVLRMRLDVLGRSLPLHPALRLGG